MWIDFEIVEEMANWRSNVMCGGTDGLSMDCRVDLYAGIFALTVQFQNQDQFLISHKNQVFLFNLFKKFKK